LALRVAKRDGDILAVDIPSGLEPVAERSHKTRDLAGELAIEEGDHRHRLLCSRRERWCKRRNTQAHD
jgi:hypothetical protein